MTNATVVGMHVSFVSSECIALTVSFQLTNSRKYTLKITIGRKTCNRSPVCVSHAPPLVLNSFQASSNW